jgi:hypothetical protein
MSEPVAIAPERFFDFVGGPGLSVVFLSVHPVHSFNTALPPLLNQGAAADGDVALGTMDMATLLLSGGAVLRFLQREIAAAGVPAPPGLGVVPGYFLFRGGELLAWDPGLPRLADAAHFVPGAVLGAAWWARTEDLTFLLRALRHVADQVTAQRIATAFHAAAAAPPGHRRAWSPPGSPGRATPPQDEAWARSVLGVSRSASADEVRDAWRKRRMETHPDHAAGDPAEFERRSAMAAEINRAREVLLGSRRARRASA